MLVDSTHIATDTRCDNIARRPCMSCSFGCLVCLAFTNTKFSVLSCLQERDLAEGLSMSHQSAPLSSSSSSNGSNSGLLSPPVPNNNRTVLTDEEMVKSLSHINALVTEFHMVSSTKQSIAKPK